jgi:hypothetical protein
MTIRSPEAQSVVDTLNADLAANSKSRGVALSWSPREEELIRQVAATMDRRVDVAAVYRQTVTEGDAKMMVKLSAELRLLDKAVGGLLKEIDTDVVPVKESTTTVKARRAVNTRWQNERERNAAR